MTEAHNIFISWSGERSKAAALALREWLPRVLQAAKPWMSDSDIKAGTRSLEELSIALEGIKVGIICLTPDNLTSEWILFESGALSKTRDAKTRVCTYLLSGLRNEDIGRPLGMFQATRAEKNETRKLIHGINENLDAPLSVSVIDDTFDKWWPDLEAKLSALPEGSAPRKRSSEEMLTEILELNRAMVPAIADMLPAVQGIAREVEYEHGRRQMEAALRPTFTLTPAATVRLSSLLEPPPPPFTPTLTPPPPFTPTLTPPPLPKSKKS